MSKFITTKGHLQWDEKRRQYIAVSDEGYEYTGPIAQAGGVPIRETGSWAFYNDGTESGAVIIGAERENPTLDVDTIYHWRQVIEETSGNKWNNPSLKLQYSHNSGAWTDVTGTSSVIRSAPASGLVDGADTTGRITGTGSFQAWAGQDDVNGAVSDSVDPQSEYINVVFGLTIISADVADSDTISLRMWDVSIGDTFDVNQFADPVITVNEAAAAVTVSASQTEAGDSQSANIDAVVQVAATQVEAGDSQSASINAVVQVAASQAESGDTQSAAVNTIIQPVWVQGHYRYANDDGDLNGSTFIDAEDTPINQNLDEKFRLRVNWGESAHQNVAKTFNAVLEFNIDGGGWLVVGAATAVQYIGSAFVLDNATSFTERLTTPPTDIDLYSFTVFESNNTRMPVAFSKNYQEVSYNLQIDSGQVNDNQVIEFRIVDATATEVITVVDTTPVLTAKTSSVPVNITASQTEDGDSQSVSIDVVAQVAASQVEAGDSQSASIGTVVQVAASQAEAGDSQSASISAVVQVAASQAESGDGQSASIDVVVQVAASQSESGDTAAANIVVLSQLIASQLEAGDTQAANIVGVVTSTVSADQIEPGDTQAAVINNIVQLFADQSESGDAAAANIAVLSQINASQLETGDTQTASIVGVVTSTVSANQLEAGDTQAATVNNVVQLTANQPESGDIAAADVSVIVQLSASQAEAGDTQSANIVGVVTSTVSANQLEPGDTQAAAINNVIQLFADQLEPGDSQSASIVGVLSSTITADQAEIGDVQAAFVDVIVNIAANQAEFGDTQFAYILSGTVAPYANPVLVNKNRILTSANNSHTDISNKIQIMAVASNR